MTKERFLRGLAINGSLVGLMVLALNMAAHPEIAARVLGVSFEEWESRLFFIGMFAAMVLLGFLALNLIRRMMMRARQLRSRESRTLAESGTVAVEFCFAFPIMFLIIGLIHQLALVCNGALVVRYAAFSAARSALVHTETPFPGIPTEQYTQAGQNTTNGRIRKAAWVVLASISPTKRQTASTDPTITLVNDVMRRQRGGPWGTRNIRRRYNYARRYTEITSDDPRQGGTQSVLTPDVSSVWLFLPFSATETLPNPTAPRNIDIKVRFPFFLTIPGVGIIPGISERAPGNIPGRVFWLTQRVHLQGTGSREDYASMLDVLTPSSMFW